MSNLNEAATYSTTVGPTPYLVLFCGRRIGTLLRGNEKCDWRNWFASMLSASETPERNRDNLIYGFLWKKPGQKAHKQSRAATCGMWERSRLLIRANVPTRLEELLRQKDRTNVPEKNINFRAQICSQWARKYNLWMYKRAWKRLLDKITAKHKFNVVEIIIAFKKKKKKKHLRYV